MIRVFNYEFSGQDAENFCKKTKAEKKEWIQKNVNGVDDSDIDNFLETELKHQDCKCGCGEGKKSVDVQKTEENAKNNQPLSVQAETSSPEIIGENKKESNGTDAPRQRSRSKENKGK